MELRPIDRHQAAPRPPLIDDDSSTSARPSSSWQDRRDSSQAQLDNGNEPQRKVPETETAVMLEKPAAISFEALHRRTRVWWILGLYIPLLVVPWILTCIIVYRPISAPTYVDQAGRRLPGEFAVNEAWLTVINIANAVAAILTIPVTSLLLAEAAVLWLQRSKRSDSAVPLSHFYDLADRAWTDVHALSRQVFRQEHNHQGQPPPARNWFLLAAAGLIGFCSVILPLHQLLVRSNNIQVLTCQHVPFPPGDGSGPRDSACYPTAFMAVSEDPQPGMMAVMPLWNVKEQVRARLTSETQGAHQALIWSSTPSLTSDDEETQNDQILTYYADGYDGPPFSLSAVSNGTTTGVLREHAMRLNFSIACEQVPTNTLISGCSAGDAPFDVAYPWSRASINGPESFELRVCVPGSYISSPWELNRDASTIPEEIYFGALPLSGTFESSLMYGEAPFATHCTVNTTRGYFELGNYFTDGLPQPLLKQWPDAEESLLFNDYDREFPTTVNYPPFAESIDNGDYVDMSLFSPDMPLSHRLNATLYNGGDGYMIAPGPLATSAVAIFGNESFFGAALTAARSNDSSAAVNLCRNVRMPFLSVDRSDFESYVFEDYCKGMIEAAADDAEDYDYGYRISRKLVDWFEVFNDTDIATRAMGISTYHAGEALLTQSASARDGSRKIYASDGRATQVPTMSTASLIVLSLMLAVEVLALSLLGWYIWRTPAWTSTLKSLTVAQLAHAMERGALSPAGAEDERALDRLDRIDGRVGVATLGGDDGKPSWQQLIHGGPGALPTTGARKRKESKWLLY